MLVRATLHALGRKARWSKLPRWTGPKSRGGRPLIPANAYGLRENRGCERTLDHHGGRSELPRRCAGGAPGKIRRDSWGGNCFNTSASPFSARSVGGDQLRRPGQHLSRRAGRLQRAFPLARADGPTVFGVLLVLHGGYGCGGLVVRPIQHLLGARVGISPRWSLATLGTGFVSTFSVLLALRLLLGLGESVAYPAYSNIIVTRFPIDRRGLPNSLIDAGAN